MSVGQRELTFRPGLGRPSGGWPGIQEARLRVLEGMLGPPIPTRKEETN